MFEPALWRLRRGDPLPPVDVAMPRESSRAQIAGGQGSVDTQLPAASDCSRRTRPGSRGGRRSRPASRRMCAGETPGEALATVGASATGPGGRAPRVSVRSPSEIRTSPGLSPLPSECRPRGPRFYGAVGRFRDQTRSPSTQDNRLPRPPGRRVDSEELELARGLAAPRHVAESPEAARGGSSRSAQGFAPSRGY